MTICKCTKAARSTGLNQAILSSHICLCVNVWAEADQPRRMMVFLRQIIQANTFGSVCFFGRCFAHLHMLTNTQTILQTWSNIHKSGLQLHTS